MAQTLHGRGTGWLRDRPDFRDFTLNAGEAPLDDARDVPTLLSATGIADEQAKIPTSTDLRADFPAVEDQGSLGSCTANAGVGVLEYFERRAHGHHIDASRLFLYKTTRNLMGVTGDTGAYLRTTMKGMVHFGVPPEEYLPYRIGKFDEEPSAFCYAFGQSFQAIRYYRLDPPGTTPQQLLDAIKRNISSHMPAMFGFAVYDSYVQAEDSGEIPFPERGERQVGGHAVVAAGFDDHKEIQNDASNARPTVGAMLIRNSWGLDWGFSGYGWLPYDYVTKGLAVDWWSLVSAGWVDAGQFEL